MANTIEIDEIAQRTSLPMEQEQNRKWYYKACDKETPADQGDFLQARPGPENSVRPPYPSFFPD
jgi:hypothetical protein